MFHAGIITCVFYFLYTVLLYSRKSSVPELLISSIPEPRGISQL